jgi:Na+/H+ antiporter NhaC
MRGSWLWLILLIAGIVIWLWLDHRERRRSTDQLPRHSGLRLVFASLAALVMLFSGGCSLLLFAVEITSGKNYLFDGLPALLVAGAMPFLLGPVAFWLLVRHKR